MKTMNYETAIEAIFNLIPISYSMAKQRCFQRLNSFPQSIDKDTVLEANGQSDAMPVPPDIRRRLFTNDTLKSSA